MQSIPKPLCNCNVTSLEVVRAGHFGVAMCHFSNHPDGEVSKDSDSQRSGCPSMQYLWT